MTTAKLEIPEAALRELDKKLAGLHGIHQSKVLLEGMRSAGRAVRKRSQELAPRPTTPGYKRGEKASIKTVPAYKIKAFVRRLEPILEVRVKASGRAPHFHLVELGHRIVTGGTTRRLAAVPINPTTGDVQFSSRTAGVSRRTGERGKGKIKGRVAGRPFLSRGAYASRAEQIKMMSQAVQQAIRKISGG